MSEEKTTIWTRTGGKTKREALLIGRKISADWLKEKVPLVEIRFTGELFKELNGLLATTKAEKKNLPVISLRTALIGGMEKMVSLDRDLGLVADAAGRLPCAITVFPSADDDERNAVRKQVASYLSQWVLNEVEPWAERHGIGAMVTRLKVTIDPQQIELTDVQTPLIWENDRRPNYPLIARTIAERLIGEALFDGMSCCELVANPEARANYVELMTLPEKAKRGDDVFSMVARISVCSMPYSADIYLGVSAMKRVWAKKPPFANSKMPRRVTGYVMSPGRPAIMVPVDRGEAGWEFGEGYASVQAEAGLALPTTLADAIAQRDFNSTVGWWAGLPELPTLYKYISPRTVFEGDEAALLNSVCGLLDGIVGTRHIPLREVPLARQKKPLQEMLRLTDLDFGTAGDSLVSEADCEDEEEESVEQGKKRSENLQHYRDQNIRALNLVHKDKPPILWVLGGTPREQEIIRDSVSTLFGESVTINTEPLPAGTHGLRADLDCKDGKAINRFTERISKWASTVATIKQVSGDRPIIALICAADKYNNRSEDSVNYYAGIHAMSRIGANVHHVLPIENSDDRDSIQSFLHRTQSALLDVFLAHSGIIFGVKELVAQLIPAESAPRCIYGIQVLRSRARSKSGESGVTFILYTRLVVETGVTEVQIVYSASGARKRSEWMPLAKGLQWIGSQRQLNQGDDRWLKASFTEATKETLLAIHAEDSYAIVMVDWQSVAGLWRGLRDEDLVPGIKPRLDSADLSVFCNMSFVRLRRGSDTLALRTEARMGFEGWQDAENRLRTGEPYIDAYYTTNKVLAEVTEEILATDKSYGHFVVSMGYAKTVQVKRGFSCYRSTQRMKKLTDGARYELKVLDPAEMDAALPASIEVTVVSSPPTVSPKNIAMLAMGLRIGYAHYNDWTTLPAPMFFRRKIEDYVIRFPDDDEIIPAAQTMEDAVAATENLETIAVESGSGTQLARIQKPESTVATPPSDHSEEDTFLELGKTEKLVGEGDELLARAKVTEMPVMLKMKDPKQRLLVQRMMQEDANVRVRVDLPYWVRLNGIFGPVTPMVRRGASQCWKVLRDFGFVSVRGAKGKKPPEGEFLNWLASLLPIPQAAYAFAPYCGGIGGIEFVPFTKIIYEEYNPGRPAEEQFSSTTLSPESLEVMTEWADETGHDVMMGWLIFQVSQYPIAGWCEAVIGTMKSVPGPHTEEALKYYLDVASAANDALAQKDHLSKFQTVVRRRPKPVIEAPEPKPAVPAERLSVKEGAQAEPPKAEVAAKAATVEVPVVVEAPASPVNLVSDEARPVSPVAEPIMAVEVDKPAVVEAMAAVSPVTISGEASQIMVLRSALVKLVSTIEPGTSAFEDAIGEIYSNLDALKVLHRQEQEKNSQEEVRRERMVAFTERRDRVLGELFLLKDELELGTIGIRDVLFEDIEESEESVTEIEEILGDIAALTKQLKTIEELPQTQAIAERQKRNRITSETLDAIAESGASLKELLSKSRCFIVVNETVEGETEDIRDQLGSDKPDLVPVRQSADAADGDPIFDSPLSTPPAAHVIAPHVAEIAAMAMETSDVTVEDAPAVSETFIATDPAPPVAEVPDLESDPLMEEIPSAPPVSAPSAREAPAAPDEPVSMVGYARLPEAKDEYAFDAGADADFGDSGVTVDFVDEQAATLNKLLQRRLYGLASVHVQSMKSLLDDFKDGDVNSHYVILRALVNSLYRMDCQFEFDPKLDSDLKTLVESRELSGNDLCEPSAMALGVLAAGLSSMLFATQDVQWNLADTVGSRLAGLPALHGLIEHIDTIRQRGLVLTRDMFVISHIGDQAAIKQELERFQKRASEWKNSAELYSSWSHKGFRAMHDEIFSPKSPIGRCIELIAAGDSVNVHTAYEEIRRKLEKPAATIDDYYRKVGERTRPDGVFRDRAIGNIEATRRFIESYREHLQRKEKPNHALYRNIQTFLASLHRRLEDAQLELKALVPTTKLAMLYREAALFALRCALRLFDNSQAPVCIPQEKQKLLVQAPLNRELMPALDKIDEFTPELCSPYDVLEETGRWTMEGLSIDAGGENIDVALKEAMQVHLKAQRFLPAFYIESLVPRSMISTSEPLMQLYINKKAAFTSDLQQARQRVTHAMTLSALTQNEANRMQRVIEEMQECLRPDRGIGHPEGESITYSDFPHAAAALRHNVLMPLEALLDQVANDLEADLNKYIEDNRGRASAQDTQRIRSMIKSENAAVLRTAHDALAMLKSTHKLPGRLGGPTDVASAYDKFISEVHRDLGGNKNHLEMLMDRLNAERSEADPEWLKELDHEHRCEGSKLIAAWLKLFSTPRKDILDTANPLIDVFHALGINHEPMTLSEHGRNNRTRFMLPERSFTFPTTPDEEMFIPPVLGSWATHIQGFMMFGVPQETDLRQLMHEIGGTPTVVMARTRLNMQKRARISGAAPVLLIDDELVAYIALHPMERLQALMRIAILTFFTNPYDDYGGRPVPSEMFFGRQTELSRLRDVKSLGVLYGGRRLGKSSLLSQVERETNQTLGSTAAYISMDTIDSSSEHVIAAWEFIYRNLRSRKIVGQMPNNATKWQEIRDWIEKEILAKPELKSLYLLIDEADALMGRELKLAKGEVSFVRSLQQMVDNLQNSCHIRYVIAGLHNMARMTTEENSVLGKAEPIALEPFSSPADIQRGIRLITKPLAAMGYLFGEGSEDLPLRILSVCNFYPAFIQLYCKCLVDRLQNNRQDVKPPLYIKPEDLDAVENDSTLLSELRRKFELNLDLDKRYKAIALILADTYYSKIEDSHYQGLNISEISELCETFATNHFLNAGPGVYEALLEEMGKLNVIERVGTRYVLRNPNIAMMMGDRERVSHKLEELAKEPPEDARNRGERRVYMDSGAARSLFPFPVSWIRRYMDASDGEVLVVTGNDLSGIMDLARPAGKEEWKIGQDGIFLMLPGSGPMAANDYVAKLRKSKQENLGRRIVAVRPTSWVISQIHDFVAAAAKAVKHDIEVRFVLLAMPERAYEIASAIDAGTLAEEAGKWRMVPVPQWSEDALFLHMHENTEISDSSAALGSLIDASCGFHREIQRISSGKTKLEELPKLLAMAKQVLAPSLDEFYKRVGLPPSFQDERRKAIEGMLEAINGAPRHSTEVSDVCDLLGVTQGELSFMYWMGLLQEGPGCTWKIPALYADLLKR